MTIQLHQFELKHFSDQEIQDEYRRRQFAHERKITQMQENERISTVKKFVELVHQKNKDIPILIYEKSKHSTWYINLKSYSTYPQQFLFSHFDFFKTRPMTRQLLNSTSLTDSDMNLIADGFCSLYDYDRQNIIKNKKKWIYIIKGINCDSRIAYRLMLKSDIVKYNPKV